MFGCCGGFICIGVDNECNTWKYNPKLRDCYATNHFTCIWRGYNRQYLPAFCKPSILNRYYYPNISLKIALSLRRFFLATMSSKQSSRKRKAETSNENVSKSKKTKSSTEEIFNMKRVLTLTKHENVSSKYKGITYWMWRDQRVQGIK